jgi:hypothetical protein
MSRMTVEFDLPDDDEAGKIAMAIEDVVGEFGVESIDWDTANE